MEVDVDAPAQRTRSRSRSETRASGKKATVAAGAEHVGEGTDAANVDMEHSMNDTVQINPKKTKSALKRSAMQMELEGQVESMKEFSDRYLERRLEIIQLRKREIGLREEELTIQNVLDKRHGLR